MSVTDRDLGWRRVKREINKLHNMYTAVGFFSDDKTDEGDLVAYIASIHEFGTDSAGRNRNVTIPERSFMRAWFDQNKKKIQSFMAKLYKKVLDGKLTAEQAMRILGEWATGEIKNFIIKLDSPPNAPSTIAKKGSSNPLIDKGQMLNSVTHKEFHGRVKYK